MPEGNPSLHDVCGEWYRLVLPFSRFWGNVTSTVSLPGKLEY